jgi:exonuclease VII large subunit
VPAAAKKRSRRTGRPRASQLPRAADEGRESLDFYLQEISRIPLLTVEEETALARRAFKGDIDAQERLARQHSGLELLAPQRTLERGYAVLLDAKGHAIRDPNALHARAHIEARLAQGTADIEIARVQPKLEL